MSKHTPGPWVRSTYGFQVLSAGAKRTICELGGRLPEDEQVANATLIAAAPDLVEALEGLMWRFDEDDTDPHATEETAPDIQAARLALARAKGESR